ncbi:hypothetical protein [Thiococcus pfennigii]|uniref:hypothetical protein n=1 Tax=Thiococcus pfennigii TaxID=1057 RepID=UPI001906EE90|nr:hypothetical protein [Thiococcus pfennigii]MBK1701411.1 hypothetical protein [Thiococcus pfennigii]MBK1733360.1 hypothetical protein [Thiococcus pfennigii]
MTLEEYLGQAVILAILFLYPVYRICRRAGVNPLISLTIFIPYGGILLTGVILSLSKWKLGGSTGGGR